MASMPGENDLILEYPPVGASAEESEPPTERTYHGLTEYTVHRGDEGFQAAVDHPWHYRHVREMLALYRRAFAHSAGGGTVKLHWNDEPMDAAAWRREFCQALDRRINLKAGIVPAGRRASEGHQTDLRRDQHDLHATIGQRVRVYQFRTPEVRRRFGHLLASAAD